jgi:hypothetical protein
MPLTTPLSTLATLSSEDSQTISTDSPSGLIVAFKENSASTFSFIFF